MVGTINSWPPADQAHLLAVAHRDLRIARQNISDLQYYVDGYTAHLSDCAGAWDAGIPLMVAETCPRLEGGVRASLEETENWTFLIGYIIMNCVCVVPVRIYNTSLHRWSDSDCIRAGH